MRRIGGALLTLATAIATHRAHAPMAIRRLTWSAFASSALILLLTIEAAPIMFEIGASPDDPAILTPLIESFVAWTLPRIALADLSFVFMMTALVLTARSGR